MKNIKFKAISFMDSEKPENVFFYYNVTMPEALNKVSKGLKYTLTNNGFEWVETGAVDPVKNMKISIKAYYY